MKRLVVVLLAFSALGAHAAPAHAAVPCWKQVVNDWYADGKIGTAYPLHCYRDAKSHLKTDQLVYSSLGDDIEAALAAAVAARSGKHVPAQVGKGFRAATLASARSARSGTRGVSGRRATRGASVSHDASGRPVADTSSGSSVPLPLLILGGVALGLIAIGGVGAAVRHRRSSL